MSEVDQTQLKRYIEIEKEIQKAEGQNSLKNYELKKKSADDVAETIKEVEIQLKQCQVQTRKEKDDVDKMQSQSIRDMFKDQTEFNAQLSREQEEYLEAKNKEEMAKRTLEDLKKQHKELEEVAQKHKDPADVLKSMYEERDKLLSDIFGGEYGSDRENFLEAQFDSLIDKKQRVSVANYKWTNGRILLHHAVSQLKHAVAKWDELGKLPSQQMQQKYTVATEVRNNLVASNQNVTAAQRYLNTIEFPYCKPKELETLGRATANIYTDMADPNRQKHARECYNTTYLRAIALLQWVDMVITGTIQKDLTKVTEEARKVEKELRAERIKLIRDKISESGGDVKGLNDADNLIPDQQKLSDEDMDLKDIGVTRPAPVGDRELPDAQNQQPEPPAPTPLPLNELAPMPSDNDLFGDISELKEQYKKNNEEFMKTQALNKARMEQGLHAKLAARRHKKQ